MVTHIVCESEKIYANTPFKDSWMFYHDALSLMTANDCREWMKTQKISEDSDVTFYDKWILPQHGLNNGLQRFKDRPVGNSPEMMPLDNCLNKDWHDLVGLQRGFCAMCGADKNDPRLFDLSTPKKISSAYLRVWNPSMGGVGPSSTRIIEDIKKVVASMHQIYKAEGAFVPGLAQQIGKRHIISHIKSQIWVGKRTKKEVVATLFADRVDLHADLKALLDKRAQREALAGRD